MDIHKEQGVSMNCIYCKVIFPDTKTIECKYCDGIGSYFKQARMMDKKSSNDYILNILGDNMININELDNNILISLIEMITIYNFDLKDAMIRILRFR